MAISGITKIHFVVGDYYSKRVNFSGVATTSISKVFITCKELNICKELIKQEQGYYLFELTPLETSSINITQPFYGTYDLTVMFGDRKIETFCHNYPINVYPKENEVVCNVK